MIRIKRNTDDWCGRDGKIGYKGTEYSLPLLSAEELKILDLELKEDKQLLTEILQRNDLEELEGEWRREVKGTISVRKRQLVAICIDFLRRKKLTRPLENFAFSAVYELLGMDVLAKVKEKARELQEAARKNTSPMKEEREYIPLMVPNEEKMCTNKVKHKDRSSANGQIEDMKIHNRNTRGVNAYLCPFCGFYHVGHKPKGAVWSRADQVLLDE